MSSSGLLHSWINSGVLDEVSMLLHQVSTDGSELLLTSPKLGSNSVKGGVVEQKLNVNISNCSYLLKRKKHGEYSNNISYEIEENVTLKAQLRGTGVPHQVQPPLGISKKVQKKKKSEVKPKKVASVSFLSVLFFMLLFVGLGESNQQNTNKGVDECVNVSNGSDPLAASLYIPRNNKLVSIEGNSTILGDLDPADPGIHPRLSRSLSAGQKNFVLMNMIKIHVNNTSPYKH
ncbi:hypothetical protein R3W88_011805 [Solanum pinnatisectum]|uniref:Uncharacterized protein n=1 Tax=Solanum pinnatisectum TaxID=50273 RepID=A0AAV9LB24_9SOLN|nr:hypothetical protein R3W88_011805 [Solanum pinnatisectum]